MERAENWGRQKSFGDIRPEDLNSILETQITKFFLSFFNYCVLSVRFDNKHKGEKKNELENMASFGLQIQLTSNFYRSRRRSFFPMAMSA